MVKSRTKAQLLAEIEELRRQVAELERANRERPEEASRGDEEAIRAVLDSTADGILAVDAQGRVLFANKRFAQMWHIPPDLLEAGEDEELLRFVVDQLLHPEEFLAKVHELYQSFKDDFETIYFRDGRVFERESRPFMKGDQLAGRVWSFRDVTGMRHRELNRSIPE